MSIEAVHRFCQCCTSGWNADSLRATHKCRCVVYTHCHWPFSIVSNLSQEPRPIGFRHPTARNVLLLPNWCVPNWMPARADNARTRLISGPSSRAAGGSICLRDSNLGESAFSHIIGSGGGSSPSANLTRMTYSPRTAFKYPIRSLRQVCPPSSLMALPGAGCPASIASDQPAIAVCGRSTVQRCSRLLSVLIPIFHTMNRIRVALVLARQLPHHLLTLARARCFPDRVGRVYKLFPARLSRAV